MPTEMKTIEARLRESAHDELKKEVAATFKPAFDLLRSAGWPWVNLRALSGSELIAFRAHEVLGAIEKALVSELTVPRGNKACVEFMARIESLQNQIDELREATHEH